MADLKPCPFCGKAPRRMSAKSGYPPKICCSNGHCGACGKGMSEQQWNTRNVSAVQGVPDGWKLAPLFASQKMGISGAEVSEHWDKITPEKARIIYHTMICDAPTPADGTGKSRRDQAS